MKSGSAEIILQLVFLRQSHAPSSPLDTHRVHHAGMRSPWRSRAPAVRAEVQTRHPAVPSVNKHRKDHQCRMQEDLMEWRMGRVEHIQRSRSCSNGMLPPA